MWDELSVERDIADDELATAIARSLGVDRERITVVASMEHAPGSGITVEKRTYPGDFALRVGLYGVPDHTDRMAFYRALAKSLACKLLVDDGDVNPYTAMLVAPGGDAVRVDLDAAALDGSDEALVVTGLHRHTYGDDEVPDVLRPEFRRPTRGEALAHVVEDYMRDGKLPAPRDHDAFMAAYTPRVQDAEHELTELLRRLVHRPATAADERTLRDASLVLRRAFPEPDAAGGFIAEILRCADAVLTEPWDPSVPGDLD